VAPQERKEPLLVGDEDPKSILIEKGRLIHTYKVASKGFRPCL
jgi:hypothetical protein